MDKLTRYVLNGAGCEQCVAQMTELPNGAWVWYEDHLTALAAIRAAVEAERAAGSDWGEPSSREFRARAALDALLGGG